MTRGWLLAALLLAAAPGCSTARPVPAPEPPRERAAPPPEPGSTRAAPEDAVPCTVEPAGREISQLGAGDVGATVVVEGEARMGHAFCTQMACEIRCCNRCGAPLLLGGDETGRGGLLLASQGGSDLMCGGTDCGITCPGMQPGHRYRITGRLSARGPDGGFTMDVSSVCRRAIEPGATAPERDQAAGDDGDEPALP